MDFTSQILLPVSLGVGGRGRSKCVAMWYLVAGWGYSSTMCIHIYNWAPLAYFGSIKMSIEFSDGHSNLLVRFS